MLRLKYFYYISDMKRFYISGDLNQMAIQKRVLSQHGIQTVQSDVYPTVSMEDLPKALQIIWKNKVEGWWHYKDEYIKYSICSAEEFKNGFK